MWSGWWSTMDCSSPSAPRRTPPAPFTTQSPAWHHPVGWTWCLSPLILESQHKKKWLSPPWVFRKPSLPGQVDSLAPPSAADPVTPPRPIALTPLETSFSFPCLHQGPSALRLHRAPSDHQVPLGQKSPFLRHRPSSPLLCSVSPPLWLNLTPTSFRLCLCPKSL